jgi:hypothetical protein
MQEVCQEIFREWSHLLERASKSIRDGRCLNTRILLIATMATHQPATGAEAGRRWSVRLFVVSIDDQI